MLSRRAGRSFFFSFVVHKVRDRQDVCDVTLKMEAACSSQILVTTCKTTWSHTLKWEELGDGIPKWDA